MRKWLPLVILASAQFIMVLDSSVMNVSISQIVADLDTPVTGVLSAITMYTLVMAAFMLVGAKLGDILGRDRAFGLGLAVYGLGSLITALSPNLTVLLIGWSGIEGLGAVLVIPAIAALTAANYEGKERAFAYSMIGGAAGAAIAAGPLIGGYVTTTWSWRYVFIGEVLVVIAVLIVHRRMKRAPKPEHPPRLDYGGAALSAVALGLIVFGILKSSTWGWIKPIAAPTIGGHEITPLGFSLVPFLLIGGFVVLGSFLVFDERRDGDRCARAGRDDRRDPERDGLRGLAHLLRDRRRAPHVTARQRDHVLRPAGRDERGRWPPGHGAEPRRVPGHGADRLGAAARTAERVQLADPGEPGRLGRCEDPDLGGNREGDPDRHDRAGASDAARRRVEPGRCGRRHG